jgi:hypothetical protein
MKRLLLACLLAVPSWATISNLMIFEVSTTGSNSNGGCFKEGATGTDYTINAGAYNFTDLVITATNTIVTSASHNFVAADVGNCMRITAGTGFTTGIYEIISVATNAATLDRAAGTASSTGGTYFVGGPLLTLGQLNTDMCLNCRAYVHGDGTYSISATVGWSFTPNIRNWIKGYQSIRGDDLPFILQASSNFGGDMMDNGVSHLTVYNVILDVNSQTNPRCFGLTAGESSAVNIECKNFNNTNNLFATTTRSWFRQIYVHDGTSGNTVVALNGTSAWCVDCTVRNVAGANSAAFVLGDQTLCLRCTVDSLTGATSDAFYCDGNGGAIESASVYNITGSAVRITSNNCNEMSIFNLVVDTAATVINNTSGNGGRTGDILSRYIFYHNISGTAFTNVTAGPNTTLLTANPFNAPSSHDLTLNTTSGGGAVVRGAGYPQSINGIVGSSHPDAGVMQHADPAASGGSFGSVQ